MPIHDWSKVPSGLFHDFHLAWSAELRKALNEGVLPEGYEAYAEQKMGGPEPDVIAINVGSAIPSTDDTVGGVALAAPRTKRIQRLESETAIYARKASRITVRHHLGHVVAVIEIVSPGNKDSKAAFCDFLDKSVRFLRGGVHLMVLDLFPPSRRDPNGIHRAIFDELADLPEDPPSDKPLIFVSYQSSDPIVAYIEPLAVGDPIPELPLYYAHEKYVNVPLDSSYAAAWKSSGKRLRELVTAHSGG